MRARRSRPASFLRGRHGAPRARDATGHGASRERREDASRRGLVLPPSLRPARRAGRCGERGARPGDRRGPARPGARSRAVPPPLRARKGRHGSRPPRLGPAAPAPRRAQDDPRGSGRERGRDPPLPPRGRGGRAPPPSGDRRRPRGRRAPEGRPRLSRRALHRHGARLGLERALEAVRDAARAVHHAHGQGVVHRDLKPGNILIDRSDRAHVVDFGLANIRGSGTKLTRTGMAMGTPAYMPPEQASGERADERSDVYSLGATLYHVLTGRPPFEGVTDVNLVVAVLTRDPVPPGKLNRRAAGDLETICLKCLEKEPARRYRTAGEVADELDRHLAGEPIAARPQGPLGRLGRRARRNKALSALVALGAVALLAAPAALVRAARAEREAIVERARSDAAARREKFEAARAAARAGASPKENAEARQRRLRPLLGLGLDSLQVTARLAALVPGDKDALAAAFEASMALGEVSLEAEQWEIAASAFERAGDLHVDDGRAARALRGVDQGRRRVLDEHRAALERTIAELGSGTFAGARDDALFALVAHREPQTVSILARELDGVTRDLLAATRETVLAAAQPTPAESRDGGQPIDGLAAAVDRWLSLPLDVDVPADLDAFLA
ncbi:protein kinase, partial [bacterium]|nr:protein kinase [bacterium]